MRQARKSIWADLGVSQEVRRAIGVVLVFSIFVNLLILTSPIYMMQVYDRVLVSGQIETLLFLSVMAVLALTVLGLLDGARAYMLNRFGRYLDLALRDPVLMQAIAQSRTVAGNQRKLVEDLGTMRNYLGSPSILPFIDAPWVPFFVVIISLMHPWLGILAVVSAVLLFALAVANDHFSRQWLRQAASQQSAAMEFASSAIQNSEVVHAMGMQAAVSRRYRKHIDDVGESSQRAGDIGSAITAASKALRIAVQSAALGLGAYLVIKAELSPGGMIASSIVLGRALAPIEQTIGSWKQFLSARDAYANIKGFLEKVAATDDRISLPGVKGALSAEGVFFQLPNSSKPTLRNIAFSLEPGQVVALVGPSASGKSTLCRLLVGANIPSAGSVRLDGADITGLSPEDTRRYIGYLPQSVELFSGTVRDNIARMGAADDEAVVAAARLAGCHDMILRLPAGYDTELGPRGSFISAGQRQRIGLARALYGNPRLLVLDEPNSNLDQDGEMALIEAIRQVKLGLTTVVVVSHRTSLLQPVDKLAVLRDGMLERFGDRDEVLREMSPRAPQKPALVPVAEPARQGATT